MQKKVYAVDDIAANVDLMEAILKNDSDIVVQKALNGKELFKSLEKNGCPDVLLLDLMMPEMSGFTVLKKLKSIREKHYFPVIVLSALTDKQSIINALSLGADDYITKPFFVEELRVRIYNMLKLKERSEILNTSLDVMESNLLEKLRMLEQTQLEIIIKLGKASEFRDDETGKHIERISSFATTIAEQLNIDRNLRALMKHASPMHDVGKIGIPDSVLLKPGRLTDDEFTIVKLHTIIGGRILGGTALPILEYAKEIALSHHERWDGKGYPLALKGEDIPLSGRIVAITDVFDALTSDRVYKAAWPIERAIDYIKEQREGQFDPAVTDAFFQVIDDIIQIRKIKSDTPSVKSIIQQITDGDINIEELTEQWR